MRRSYLLVLGALLVAISSTPSSFAQVNSVALDRYKELHPKARYYGTQFYDNEGFYEDIGTVSAIYGTVLATGQTPIDSAWNHVQNIDGLYVKDIGELIPAVQASGQVLQGVMYNKETETHKFHTFRFNQTKGGVPVFRSGIGFLVRNEANYPLVVAGSNFKELDGFDVAVVGEPVVTAQMKANTIAYMESQSPRVKSVLRANNRLPLNITEEKNIIWAGVSNVEVEPQMAVVYMAERGTVQSTPNYWKYLVVTSAATGEILHAENQVHQVDVEGTVSGRGTVGLSSVNCDPSETFRLPYASVEILGGNSTIADGDGNFVIPNSGSGNVTVRSQLSGIYFDLFDQSQGGATPFIDQVVSPPGPVDFLHNPTGNSEFPTANVNVYVQANLVRDFVLSFEPTFPTIANQTNFDINVNIDATCNATYNGSAINFYRAGGGCNNTTIPDVVHHEYGHHLINVTGNGQGQMGEGTGDTIGMLIEDEPILGNGFLASNCANGIRNADNDKQYPCDGAIHDCGQLISGCVWDVRNALVASGYTDYREINASLFLGMLIVRGQMQPGNTTISPFISLLYVELDDDDGNIGNGSPHYPEIAQGFGLHNMDPPPLELLEITFPNGTPDMVSPSGGTSFEVQIAGLEEDYAFGTGELNFDDGSGFQSVPLTTTGNMGTFLATFPPTECGSIVRFYISAQTQQSGAEVTSPQNAPTEAFETLSAVSIATGFADNFETNTGWSVSGDAGDGQWSRGVPNGGGDRGDPANDADGSGNCYVTDNVDGNSDVDDGSTILTSPTFDATAEDGIASVSYHRWYHNTFGNAPAADVFVVDISNDNGATWTNLETVGPAGDEVSGGWIKKTFTISDFVEPSAQMRLRFNASDLGDGSVVEAGVDGLEVSYINCEEPVATPTGYTLIRGEYVSGDLNDMAESDDSAFVLLRQLGFNRSRPVTVDFDSTVANDNPSTLTLTIEARGSLTGINQSIFLFNYTQGTLIQFDVTDIFDTDNVAQVVITENASDYVEPGTGNVNIRLGYRPKGTAVIRRQPWNILIDQITWETD